MLFRIFDAKRYNSYEVELNGKLVSNLSTKAIILNKPGVRFPGFVKMIVMKTANEMAVDIFHDPIVGDYSLPRQRWHFGIVKWWPMEPSL